MYELRRRLTLLCAVVLPLPLLAADLQPEDFAWGQRLHTDGGQPFYRLNLPPVLYTGAAHSDLRDVRVFNAAGESVPFSLVAEPNTSTTSAQRTLLQAFSLPAGAEASASEGQLSITRNGLDLSWNLTGEKQQVQQLLLVVPGDNETRTLSAIRLDWQPSASSWQQRVSVESSNDLQEWSTVSSDQPLMDLQQAGQHLRIDTVRFPETTARYWRLTLGRGPAPILKTAEGLYQTQAWSTALNWLAPTRTETTQDGQRIYHFSLPQPAEYLRLRLPQDNSVVPYTLQYRRDAKGSWQILPDGVAWRLTLDGKQQESPWRELGGIEIGDLRISSRNGWGAGEPGIELGRRSQHLVFNARGSGPWLLTWGSAAATPQNLAPELLIPGYSEESLMDLPQAIPTESVTLGGEQRRVEPGPAERQARWQTRLLWALLIAGAGILAWLALTLWRDMPRAADSKK